MEKCTEKSMNHRMLKSIDARGLQCPLPVIEAKKAIEGMTKCGTITITVDNEIAVQNVLKLAKQKGIDAECEFVSKDEYVVTFKIVDVIKQGEKVQKRNNAEEKSSAGETSEEETSDEKSSDEKTSLETNHVDNTKKKKTVVIISSNAMGNGDDKLGTTLMKGFIFSLLKQDTLPDTIIFYNSGAFLVAEGSDSLEDLRSLEAEGVEIMACGACLDYYQLTDKRRVGSVTNMYAITEILMNAGLIIRP